MKKPKSTAVRTSRGFTGFARTIATGGAASAAPLRKGVERFVSCMYVNTFLFGKGKRSEYLPVYLPGSLRCRYLSRVFLEVARQVLAQIQDRFVACSEAVGTSLPFVVPHSLNRRQHRRVGFVVPHEDRGTSLAAGALLGQLAIDQGTEPVQKRWGIVVILPLAKMLNGLRGMSQGICKMGKHFPDGPCRRAGFAVPVSIGKLLHHGMKGGTCFLQLAT